MISHDHQCIFIHIPKTAGQSIETVFLNDLGLDWETRDPLLLRYNINKNIETNSLAHLKATDYYSHHFISKKLYDQYFKFTFVRNPWDRVVSFYKYLNAYKYYISFETFVTKELPELLNWYPFVRPQYDFIYSNDICQVDYIGRFERLHDDFRYVANVTGIGDVDLPHVNKSGQTYGLKYIIKKFIEAIKRNPKLLGDLRLSNPKKISNYRDVYTTESKLIVEKLYADDIEKFDYEW